MTTRPARGLLGALVVAGLLNLLTRATGVGWLALGSAAALGVVLAAFALRPRLGDLEVHLEGQDRVQVGDLLTQVLVVRNPGPRHTPTARWVDRCPGFDSTEVDLPPMAPGDTVRLPLVRRAVLRGAHVGASADLVSTAPFGVLRCTAPVALNEVLVTPVPDELRGDPRRAGAQGVGLPMGTAGVGLEVLGLRPWRSGDSARSISARASARHGRPVVLEREQERAPGSTLVVLAVGGSSGPTWERSISYAAGRVLQALEEGSRVELVAGPGVPDVPRILDRAAVLEFFTRVDQAGDLGKDVLRDRALSIHPGGYLIYLAGSRATVQIAEAPGDACCRREVLR